MGWDVVEVPDDERMLNAVKVRYSLYSNKKNSDFAKL